MLLQSATPGGGPGVVRGYGAGGRTADSSTWDARVEAVRQAVDIVDIAGEMTELQRRGKRHVGLCPIHVETTPSFSVLHGRNVWYCFGCGEGGDAIDLWQRWTGHDFVETIQVLGARYGITVRDPSHRRSGRVRRRRTMTALAALEIVDTETLVVEMVVDRIRNGDPVEMHAADLELASSRIAGVRREFLGAPA